MKKEKTKKNLFYNIIIFLLILVIGYSVYQIGTILWGYYQGSKTYDAASELAGLRDGSENAVNFDKLKEANPDTVGWIRLYGTPINYPIVQAQDNDYYLYRMFNKEWNSNGSIFIDYRVENPFDDFNTIIYGHRMKDNSMFHDLINYRDADFYKKHRTMELFTPTQDYDVHIFGVVTVPADSSMYKFTFNNYEKQSYINWIKENTETATDVEVSPEDKIVMLSTCTYEFDDARLVVYGKLVPREK